MIVSHRHRFVFVAVPRVATRALRQALTMQLDAMDWQQQNLFARHRLPVPDLAAAEHGHLSVRDLRPRLPQEYWQSYLKFAFVRDPFERFVDSFLSLEAADDPDPAAVAVRMKRALGTQRFRRRRLTLPQRHFLVDEEGRLAVDFVGRFETLDASWRQLCTRLGLAAVPLARRREPERQDWTRYYDAELAGMVADYYRDDLECFGYPSRPQPPSS
ncbi:MAG TPA: sulfotransferase family 2 domain-containing protein [Woeseiaceae bacterium]|nr:sulfotransferase family 2 domain-containing protein [Woeseiaceae bacterium]